ncbi:MAG: chorismate synthase [Dehalococcoidales bacterium]|nr:MAG: chorismate synthase [Dehalococcoidales bacterium]
MANSIGKLFTVTSFGESHGRCVGIIIDGCPAGLAITKDDIQKEVDRRKPKSGISTTRNEPETVEILSGINDGHSTGAPVCLMIWNADADSSVYEKIRLLPRPGHADYTNFVKYGGYADYRGGGRSSGRITAGYVMAGAIAKKLLDSIGIEILAHTTEIGGIKAAEIEPEDIKKIAENNILRCADPEAATNMMKTIEKAQSEGDSVGGLIECFALNVPAGLGEPAFDTLEGDLAKAMFSIPAVKGIEFGSGFSSARMKGSENNDPFLIEKGKVVTATNNSGGILGGISNGMPIVLRVAIKPTPSISIQQDTVDLGTMTDSKIVITGRHDACIVPRAVPVVEAMMAVTICDFGKRAGIIPEVIG